MEILKLNETPVRTSRNFNINNIKLENVKIPEVVKNFTNVKIKNETDKIKIDSNLDELFLNYGVGNIFVEQVKKIANKKLKITIDTKIKKEVFIDFTLDEENNNLIDNIEIIANENSKATIYLKYESKISAFHNGVLKVIAKENSNIDVVIVNLVSSSTNNFLSVENEILDNAKVNFVIVDFGGNASITNLYSNIIGNEAENNINTIYLGKDNQLKDINYICDLKGKKSNVNIEVQGALKDSAKKHFKGTIDFKRGCKKSKGNENEFCMLLSDKAKSLALPMLLCSEEDVEGNHSSSAGKIGEKQLFYIMSRGFELKEAMKLIVRANFNNIIEIIKNDEIKNRILYEIDTILD